MCKIDHNKYLWVIQEKKEEKSATTFSRKQPLSSSWKKKFAIPNRKRANFQKYYNHTKNILMSYSFYKVIFKNLFLFSHVGQWERLSNIFPFYKRENWGWEGGSD